MVTLERRPELYVRSDSEADLRLDRTDIRFHSLNGDKVRIELTIHNEAENRSRPTLIRLESAPLGAFVPWKPLAQLLVPALEPGATHELTTEVARPRPVPLGDFNRVPPRRVLAALSSPDQPSGNAGTRGFLELCFRFRTNNRSSKSDSSVATLAPDLWDLLCHSQPHWAGNLNVFVGTRAIERHLAKALRVYPGRTNLAMFVVGSPGRHDGFAFELVGLDSDWKAALYDMTNCESLLDNSDAPIEERKWVESYGSLAGLLAIRPPMHSPAGCLEVRVTRKSDEKQAVVEFDLDPDAQGAGCYSV